MTEQARRAVDEPIGRDQEASADDLFGSRLSMSAHLSTRQDVRTVQAGVRPIRLSPAT